MPLKDKIIINRTRVREYFSSGEVDFLASEIISAEPWIVPHLGLDASNWQDPLLGKLSEIGYGDAKLHVVGSGAVGFSLSPLKMGCDFRRAGEYSNPSDIDLALVSASLFTRAWDEILSEDYVAPKTVAREIRSAIYWGRIDHPRMPSRASLRPILRGAVDKLQRAKGFKSYKVTIRLYRRVEDLRAYIMWSMAMLKKETMS